MTNAVDELLNRLLPRYPNEAARHLDSAKPADAAALLSKQPPEVTARVLRYSRADHAALILAAAAADVVPKWASSLDPSLTANLLARLPAGERKRLLDSLPGSLVEEIEGILTYPPGTAGRIMDARVATYPMDASVQTALDRVRKTADRRISDLVITTTDGAFKGVVRLQDIVGAAPDQPLGELMSPRAIHVQPMTPRQDVVELLNKYRLASLPVVDLQDRVIGIIRQDALVGAAQEEAIGELQEMFGGSKEERALSPPWVGIKSRLPWLNINLVTAFMAATVVGLFEDTIARFTAVAVLLPVVAGQSGNTGAQALAVTMRGLALREIRVSHGWRVVAKELVVGFVNGLVIAVVTSIAVYAWSRNLGLALVMLLAMVVSMIAASAAGASIPVVLVKLGRDPATASSIILTTVTDVVGFFTFLGLATLLASMLAAS